MGDDAEDDLAVDGEGAAAGEGTAESALDHREDGLYLPALAVRLLGKVPVKLLSVATRNGGIGLAVETASSAEGRGNDAGYAKLLPALLMDPLALVACVGKKGVELVSCESLAESRLELGVIEPRAAIDNGAEDHVALCVADGGKLWPAVL